MPIYNKPYLTLDRQIDLLVRRGMEISNRAKAKLYLSKIGYYRLSAYWYPFRNSKPNPSLPARPIIEDTFKDDTKFSVVLDLYVFDKKLRLLILDALERIEIALRTDIALLMGQKGPLSHRDPRLLHGNFSRRPMKGASITLHQEWLTRLDKKFNASREDFVTHFKNKYPSNDLPIWMACELWDFGAMSYLYSGLNLSDKNHIGTSYNLPSGDMLESWLRCMNDIRNICAHHSRLWNRPLVNQPKIPKVTEIPCFDHLDGNIQGQTRLYAALLILNFLISQINPNSSWKSRLITHLKTIPNNAHLSLMQMGFPDDWDELDVWN